MLRLCCAVVAAVCCAVGATTGASAPVQCPHAPDTQPLTCPADSQCCKGRFWGGPNTCSTGTRCNTCAECCHDAIGKNQSDCDTCFHTKCKPGSYGKAGCRKVVAGKATGTCCLGGQPGFPSKTLPNCLLIGDSVAHGTFGLVKEKLKNTCALANIEGVTSGQEDGCAWSTLTGGNDGLPIKWDVIHYNEGLHSLWPRYNTSDGLNQYATNLGKFTDDLKAAGAKRLIYATMTPFMPEKYLNPSRPNTPDDPQNDVEFKNALAVKTVRAHGVAAIDDLYSAVTAVCGKVYKNCSLCDNESQYHPGGQCGFHYSPAGWELLATQTAKAISDALKLPPHSPPPPPPPPPAPGGPPIKCDSSGGGGWGSNVSCPSQSFGCVARKIGSPRNGYPWSCVMPSLASPGKKTTCSTGAPFPLSRTLKNVLIIGDSVSNGEIDSDSIEADMGKPCTAPFGNGWLLSVCPWCDRLFFGGHAGYKCA